MIIKGKMAKKFLSVIIVPHTKASARTITLSKKAAKVLAGVAILAGIALLVFLVDYSTMNVTRRKYKALLEENKHQKITLAEYEQTVDLLQSRIDEFEKYARKLNVMAGLKSQDLIEGEPGIGGPDSPQIAEPPDAQAVIPTQNLEDIQKKADLIGKNLTTLTHFFENQTLRLASTPSIWPTKGYMSSDYGWRNDPFTGKRTFHHGIDIATYYGNPVVATADGVVIQVKTDKIGGKTIKIKHLFGFTTVYCHLSKFLVKTGQKVKRGDTIGLVGKTGKALGPHVHYEVHLNGKEQNPYYYLLEE